MTLPVHDETTVGELRLTKWSECYDDYILRLLIVGDTHVGKSAIVDRWANGTEETFNSELAPTIGIDFKITTRTINQRRIRIQIYDTSGQDRFYSITRSYYRNANAIIIAYDMNNPISIRNVNMWYQRIRETCGDALPIFILGNKQDLVEWPPSIPIDVPKYIVSAKTGYQMEDTLRSMVIHTLTAMDQASAHAIANFEVVSLSSVLRPASRCCF